MQQLAACCSAPHRFASGPWRQGVCAGVCAACLAMAGRVHGDAGMGRSWAAHTDAQHRATARVAALHARVAEEGSEGVEDDGDDGRSLCSMPMSSI